MYTGYFVIPIRHVKNIRISKTYARNGSDQSFGCIKLAYTSLRASALLSWTTAQTHVGAEKVKAYTLHSKKSNFPIPKAYSGSSGTKCSVLFSVAEKLAFLQHSHSNFSSNDRTASGLTRLQCAAAHRLKEADCGSVQGKVRSVSGCSHG